MKRLAIVITLLAVLATASIAAELPYMLDVVPGLRIQQGTPIPESDYMYWIAECEIGGMYMMLGEAAKELKVTQQMFTRWEDDSGVVAAVDAAAKKLQDI